MKSISRCLIGAFCRFFATEKRNSKLKPNAIKRVLLMGNDKLGDTIVLTPVFNALKAINADIEIDCFGYEASYDALVGERRLSRLYRYKQDFSLIKLCRALRQREYDVILSLTWRKGLREGLVATWGSADDTLRVTIYRKPKYAPFWHKMVRVPNWVHHTADKYLYVLAQLLDIDQLPKAPMSIDLRPDSLRRVERWLSEQKIDDFILVNLSAGAFEMTKDELRSWSREQYAQLISALLTSEPRLRVVLVCIPKDVEHARWIQARCAKSGITRFPPTTNIHDVIALVSKANMLVSPDTSLIHVASAVGTPTVGLFSNRGKIETWGCYGVPNRMLAASPNDYRMTPLSKISVDAVFNAVLDLRKELNDSTCAAL